MKPQEIFDVCHARYRWARAALCSAHLEAMDLSSPADNYHWRPDRARAEEYKADFERLAAEALARPEWKGRRKLFRIFFLRGVEYRRALTLVGVSEGTFDYWLQEVKKTCGRKFIRAGLFPPAHYFRARDGAFGERKI